MSDWFRVLSGLLGGLAIFLFGMDMMSEGMQKSAGEKMKVILGILTKNPVMGMCAGALVTAVLQSSAATTVMAIGFVSAGLMTLPQAISIVIGANIGTTITGQLTAFTIDDLIWPIVFIGFVLYFFGKKERIKNLGETIFAFGLLFLGIVSMSNVMEPLTESKIFVELIKKVSDTPILGALAGFVMTAVIQSSSAVIAIVQNFARQTGSDGVTSIISLEGAIPIILGTNIGATVPSLLAGIGKSKDAKRTALSHTVFNVTGTVLFIFLIPLYCWFIRLISPSGGILNSASAIPRQIANAHTWFNVICMLIWLPLCGLMEKIVKFIVPGEENTVDESTPRYLDEKLFDQPVFAMHLCIRELSRIAEFADTMIDHARLAIRNLSQADIDEVNRLEDVVDKLQDETVRYLSNLSTSSALTEIQGAEIAGLMHVANDVEHVGDRCVDLIKSAETMIKKEYTFSDEALDELDESFVIVKNMLSESMEALRNSDKDLANKVLVEEDEMDDLEAQLRKRHMKRIKKQKCTPKLSVVYTEILHNIERIGDHCKNIAEAVIGDGEL